MRGYAECPNSYPHGGSPHTFGRVKGNLSNSWVLSFLPWAVFPPLQPSLCFVISHRLYPSVGTGSPWQA